MRLISQTSLLACSSVAAVARSWSVEPFPKRKAASMVPTKVSTNKDGRRFSHGVLPARRGVALPEQLGSTLHFRHRHDTIKAQEGRTAGGQPFSISGVRCAVSFDHEVGLFSLAHDQSDSVWRQNLFTLPFLSFPFLSFPPTSLCETRIQSFRERGWFNH